METIIIKLDAEKMENPDLDLIYALPERIEEYSGGMVQDNGYEYLTDTIIGIWLKTESAQEQSEKIIELFSQEQFLDNDLSLSAEIYCSNQENAEINDCVCVYPKKSNEPISR